ncbi:MAG: hypothetical protein L6Q29_00110 [Candidatus Pacebacteria bacterium]|nr:hypothetical protein [Candidatus Paceibacterota bacterium]NUQ57559.1 hypothetical protein [Candidatus Paceibacter sp.]
MKEEELYLQVSNALRPLIQATENLIKNAFIKENRENIKTWVMDKSLNDEYNSARGNGADKFMHISADKKEKFQVDKEVFKFAYSFFWNDPSAGLFGKSGCGK